MNIILFGKTGMLGNYVYHVLNNERYNIIFINREDFNIEIDSWNKLKNILSNYSNYIVINCAGVIPQNNKNDYNKYIRVNSIFPHKLNEYCILYNLKFIHITTDCVFNGIEGNYNNKVKHNATDIYGITKSLGEPIEATIIRTSIIGEEINNKNSLIEWIKSNKNSTINGYINCKWNGVSCLTLANYIKYIIHNNIYWKGVKHICSNEIISKYDICLYINQIYKLNNKVIANTNIVKNMTLSGDIIIDNSIYKQLLEQYYFSRVIDI